LPAAWPFATSVQPSVLATPLLARELNQPAQMALRMLAIAPIHATEAPPVALQRQASRPAQISPAA
jgi:hypothetical protein